MAGQQITTRGGLWRYKGVMIERVHDPERGWVWTVGRHGPEVRTVAEAMEVIDGKAGVA